MKGSLLKRWFHDGFKQHRDLFFSLHRPLQAYGCILKWGSRHTRVSWEMLAAQCRGKRRGIQFSDCLNTWSVFTLQKWRYRSARLLFLFLRSSVICIKPVNNQPVYCKWLLFSFVDFFLSGRKLSLKSCSENSDSVILTPRGACYGKWNISSKTSCGERKAFIEPVAHCPTFPLASQPNREPCLSPAFIVELLDTFNLISTTPYS